MNTPKSSRFGQGAPFDPVLTWTCGFGSGSDRNQPSGKTKNVHGCMWYRRKTNQVSKSPFMVVLTRTLKYPIGRHSTGSISPWWDRCAPVIISVNDMSFISDRRRTCHQCSIGPLRHWDGPLAVVTCIARRVSIIRPKEILLGMVVGVAHHYIYDTKLLQVECEKMEP